MCPVSAINTTIDRWLDRWLPLIKEKSRSRSILEIGCGRGDDTEVLSSAGLLVHAIDVSEQAVWATRARVPGAIVSKDNVLSYFQQSCPPVDVVVASLSLHYFSWKDTVKLVAQIRAALRPGGLLLCRLNATDDVHFGAIGHPMIEANFYDVSGESKRFFDSPSIALLFSFGWRMLSCEHRMTLKYAEPKALWEVIVEREDVHTATID